MKPSNRHFGRTTIEDSVGIPPGTQHLTLELAGSSLVAVPPGEIDVRLATAGLVLEILPHAGRLIQHSRRDGEPGPHVRSVLDGVTAIGPGRTIELAGTNTRWGLILELDVRPIERLARQAWPANPPTLPAFDDYRDGTSGRLARRAIEELLSASPETRRLERLALAIATRFLERRAGPENRLLASATERRISAAMEYAEAHLQERLEVARLASVAAMSPTWFATSFRAIAGQSVHAWVMRRRLERAWHLLRATDWPIARVADLCGFTSQAHLTTRFREAYGTTPARWRATAVA